MTVLIIPKENRNVLGFCSVNSLLNVAAWAEPIPGRKEHNGAAIDDDKIDFRYSVLVSLTCFNGVIDCLTKVVFDFKLIIRVEIPNNPDKRGRRGCSIGVLNVNNPRIPAKAKIIIALKIFSSLKII